MDHLTNHTHCHNICILALCYTGRSVNSVTEAWMIVFFWIWLYTSNHCSLRFAKAHSRSWRPESLLHPPIPSLLVPVTFRTVHKAAFMLHLKQTNIIARWAGMIERKLGYCWCSLECNVEPSLICCSCFAAGRKLNWGLPGKDSAISGEAMWVF